MGAMPGITIQGTVPYPPNADATQVLDLARELGDVARVLGQTSTQVTATARTATSTWAGAAADTFTARMADRSDTIRTTASTLARAVPVLTTYAAAITATQATYTTAATAEQAARAGMPWTAAALAAAIAAEGAAVATLQGAGFACGAALGGIVAQIAATRFLTGNNGGSASNTTPATQTSGDDGWDDIATDIWDWIFGSDQNGTTTGTTSTTGNGTAPLGLPDRDGDGIPDIFDFGGWDGSSSTGTAPLAPGDADGDGIPDWIDGRDDRQIELVDTARMPTFAANATADARFETYSAYFAEHGIDVDALGEGERAILGLRLPSASTVNNGTGEYNDRIVVVWTEGGVRHVEEFVANTEPSAQYDAAFRGRTIDGVTYARGGSVQGADADGDGRRDLGRLPTGVYHYERSTSTVVGGDNVLRGASAVDLERDVNHDGVFDAADAALVTNRAALSDRQTILFHRGSTADTDSAGCQTFPGRTDWNDFWSSLGPATGANRNPQQQFTYVLHQVAPADQPAPARVPVPVP